MKTYIGILLAILILPQLAVAQDRPGFGNNMGHAAFSVMRSLPDGMRDKFRDKMGKYREGWHQEMKQMHQEMKKMTMNIKDELKKEKPSQTRIKNILESVQNKLKTSTARAIENATTVTAEVLAQASKEERAEMAEELEELLEEWDEYRSHHRRWYQFWK